MIYDTMTSNLSFLQMSKTLKDEGIKNNKFFLVLYDEDLQGVNPYDPNLSLEYKMKIQKEVMVNFWYYIREVVRIPTTAGYSRYELNKGNLATAFLMLLNINVIECLPRQHYKTFSAVVIYSWLYLWVAINYNMVFSNKQLEDSQLNIKRMNDLIGEIPSYLKSHLDPKKDTDNINQIRINKNNNVIKA